MKLKGWIIYPRHVATKPGNASQWLKQEALRHGIELSIIFTEELASVYGDATYALLHNNRQVECYPDFVIMRDYDWILSRHFETCSIRVLNTTDSMMLCKNKMLTHQKLAARGLPTPPTVYTPDGSYNYDQLSSLFGSGQFVVKVIDGAKGENVFLVGSETEMLHAIKECNNRAICQQFISSSRGRDVRVWTVGDRAVAAVMRHSATSFKSNFSLGGNVAPFQLTPEIAELAVRASQALGIEFAGVDLLLGDSGLIVNEVNGNAGFRTLSEVGNNTIPSELFAYIRKQMNNKHA